MKLHHLFVVAIIGYGCAAKKLAVKNADMLLERQITKRLPLYSEQKAVLERDVKRFLVDQKQFVKEAIPVITEIQNDVSKVDERYDYLKALYKKLALNFSELVSKHMAELDPKQQKDFFKNLDEENRKLARKKSEDTVEENENKFEMLFGTISDKQKAIFGSYENYFKERKDLRLKNRKALYRRFEDIFPMEVSRTAKAESFLSAFKDYQDSYTEGTKNVEIIKKLLPTLSPEQKKVFKEKTEELKAIVNYYLEADY